MREPIQKARINSVSHFGRLKVYPIVKVLRKDGGYIYATVYQKSGNPFEAEFLENELTMLSP